MERELEVAASKLLNRAAQAGVFLSYSQERLLFKLAVEAFPQALKNEIVANKATLIALLRQREPDGNGALRSSRILPRVRETSELPTSFAQQRLWFIDQLGGGSPQYNIPGGLRIRGRFDEDIAERGLRRIIRRHEPLRTVFSQGAEGPLEHIREDFDFHLTRLDLSALPPEEQEQIVLKTRRADALKPFDLSADLMLRASFLRLSEDEGVLLFNMHHIASDGWSIGILVKEFSELYQAFSQGQPDPLPPLKVQYADYAQWQHEWLAGEVLERQLSYWEKQLAELPSVHSLPLDRSRPEVQPFNGAVHECTLDRRTLAGLKQIARQEQVTLFMVMHGLFALLLSRHSNSHDIVIGTPVANRRQPELEPLVGFFVNMLVLRSDCRPGCTFREYLAHIKSVNLNAQAHQDVPVESLVKRLKPQRSASHAPLFQITFSLNLLDTSVVQLGELEFTPLGSGPVAVKFDLMLEAFETSEDLRLNFIYNTDLFEESTIARLGEHLQNLARGVVTNAEEQIETLPLLSESERQHLLYELNETAADYPRESCLQELFETQVKLRPEAVAVVFAERQLSYRELNEQANQLAHYLRERGVGPDTLVGLCVERSLEMVIGLLGILKAGGAYVPLDPSYPVERLEYMIADSAPALVLTQDLLEHRLPLGPVPRLRLDADKELLSAYPRHNPRRDEVGLTSEHLAYVIYTSVPTERSRGVMGLHRSTLNRFTWMWKAFPFVDSDVCCQQTSLSFVDSIWEILGPLLAGTPLVIIPTADVKDLPRLVEALSFHKVTRIVLVPSLLRRLLESDIALDEKLSKLKVWVCSGEALTRELSEKFDEKLPGKVLLNVYGSSEVAAVTCQVLDASADTQRIPIGNPIANTQVYILDERMQPVPLGVIGEIYVAGGNLCRGYWLNPAFTAERFLPCPYSLFAGARMYHTGDFGRWLPDGSIELPVPDDNDEQTPTAELAAQLETAGRLEEAEAVLLTAPAGLDLWLHPIVESIYRRHDALRLRFTDSKEARHVVAESCVIETLPEDPSLHADFIGERCGYYQRSLETTHGPLFRAVYLPAPDQGQSYLFLATHHLIVDDVSWRALLRDLDDVYRQLHARGSIEFPAGELSYKEWGQTLATYEKSDALQRECTDWHDNYTATVPLALTTDEMEVLLNDCPATYHAELNELLLSGVYLGLRQWSGQSSVRLMLEEHGSEDLFPEIDVAEIVGCFITSYPLLLHNPDGAIGAVIKALKEQYRAIPRYGMGYGLLGHVANDELLNAAAVIDPGALLFTQQSDCSQLLKTISIFAVAGEYMSDSVGPQASRGHALCLTAEVGATVLRLRLDYDESRYSEETIAALARSIEEALRALIARR